MKKSKVEPDETALHEKKKGKGGRLKKDSALKRTKGFPLRLTSTDWIKIETAYRERLRIKKVSRNTFITDCIMSVIDGKSLVPNASLATKDLPNAKFYSTLIRYVNVNANQIRIMGVNLNQLIKRTHFLNLTAKSKREIEQQVLALLPRLNELIENNFQFFRQLKINPTADTNNSTNESVE